ncbi:translation elongation factor Ts, partial [Akkermansiaceae bacterium]|nr:translation elongation factor Ts [Akkermansiaceae bacterium]
DRAANEGVIFAQIEDAAKTGIILELNCETDFVAKNENFLAFVDVVSNTIVEGKVDSAEAALALPKEDGTLDEFIKTKVLEMGENLQLPRVTRYEVSGEGAVASYIHLGGKVGVLIEVGAEKSDTTQGASFQDLVKDLTLHIAASAPSGLAREDIPADLVEAEKDIFRKQLEGEGKPADLIEKIIPGKLSKFYSEQCLLEQGFIKDPDTTIKGLLEAKSKELGDTFTVRRFTRFGLGE